MIIIGQGQPPQWVWISAPRVQRIRSGLGITGLLVIGVALVFGIVLLAVGFSNPTAYHPISKIGVIMAGLAAVWALLSGLSLANARSRAHGEMLDVTGARVVRRMIGAWWGGTIVCAAIAAFAEVMTLGVDSRPVAFTAGSAIYLVVLALTVVLGGVSFFTARSLLGPPSPR